RLVRSGGQVHDAWRAGDWRNRHYGPGRVTVGRRPDSGDARASGNGAGSEHSAGSDHSDDYEPRAESQAEQGCDGSTGTGGEIGVAQTALSPGGKVFIHGELWDAVSSAHIAAGQRVVVRRVDGLQLEVEPVVQRSPVTATA